MKTFVFLCALSSIFLTVASAKPERHAILVAATKSWLYYRHQSTVMHAYHTLIANGFKKENIIVMFYDDLAQNPRNTEKGVVRNHPFGDNLYPTCKKDYSGDKVTAETFIAILEGDSAKAKGPVLKSGPRDSIFIYFVGLGATQYLTFPTGPGLSAQKFVAALKKLRSDKKAKKIFVLLESSFAASMVAGSLPRKGNIFVQTATHYNELPAAVYCSRVKRLCYGSLFGCGWTQRSDRLRQMKFGAKNTIWEFFNNVRTVTTLSHASMFGHLEMARGKVSDFLDYKLVPRKQNSAKPSMLETLALAAINDANDELFGEESENEEQMDVEALYQFLKMEEEVSDSDNEIPINTSFSDFEVAVMHASEESKGDASAVVSENRQVVQKTMKKIFSKITHKNINVDAEQLMKESYHLPPLTDTQAEVYDQAIKAFNEKCFDMIENPYVQYEIGKLAALAQQNVPLKEQMNAMDSVCTPQHRMAKSIY